MNVFQSTSLALFIACSPLALMAQQRAGDQDISLSYGIVSGTDIVRGISGKGRPDLDHTEYDVQTSNTGNIFATYRYSLMSRLSLGVTAGIESFTYDAYHNELMVTSYEASHKATVATLAFEAKPVYFNGNLIQLYGLAGVGGRYYHETSSNGTNTYPPPTIFVNTQWTPIGVSVGHALSGYMELGVGYKGLISGGICYKFRSGTVHTKHAVSSR